MWSITVAKHELEGVRVRVKTTGQLGTISNVLPDVNGDPWSLHVRLDDQAHYDPPMVLALDEVSRLDLH